jgi:hypothetical protein
MKKIIIFMTIGLLLWSLPLAIEAEGEEKRLGSVDSAEEAVSLAMAFTGFDKAFSLTPLERIINMAEIVVLEDTLNQFTRTVFHGKTAWKIHIPELILKTEYDQPKDDKYTFKSMNVDIYLDSLSGNLLKVIAQDESRKHQSISEKSKQLPYVTYKINNNEVLNELPSAFPKIDFLQILKILASDIYCAREIIGLYVIFSNGKESHIPAWSITMLGKPKIGSFQDIAIDYNEKAYMNAETGEILSPLMGTGELDTLKRE